MRVFALALCVAVLAPAVGSVSAQTFSVPVVYRKLPNGLRVVISEHHAAPVVVVEVMYRIGFRIEPRHRTGFAHLFEHLMFQGSEHVGKFEHVRIVNENGGTLNGSTRFDHTNYFEVMPSHALETLESQSGFGRADLLAALALYDDDPNPINTILSDLDKVTTLDVQQAATRYLVPSNRTWIDRRPGGGQ